MLSGCASISGVGSYRADIANRNLQGAEEFVANNNIKQDEALRAMHLGTIQQLKKDYDTSNQHLERAKQIAASLDAVSISESVAAITINQRVSDFKGNRFERLMIYFNKAINYLELGDNQAARIELSQAGLLLREWGIGDKANYPFLEALLAIVYEQLGNYEAALVAYRRALAAYSGNGKSAPKFLRQLYVDLLAERRRAQELDRAQRSLETKPTPALRQNNAKLAMVVASGMMTPLGSFTIYHWAADWKDDVLIALPFYPELIPIAPRPQLIWAEASANAGELGASQFGVLVNVEQEMRQALADDMARILPLAIARAVVKAQIQRKALEEDNALGALIYGASFISEVADTRSWDILPQSFHLGYLRLTPGNYSLRNIATGELQEMKLEPGMNWLFLQNR